MHVKIAVLNLTAVRMRGGYRKFEGLFGKKWKHNLGDGKASERLAGDLLERLDKGTFRMHKPEDYHLKIARSYRDDGL